MAFPSMPKQPGLARNLFILLFFCSLLLGYGLFKYRGMLSFSPQGLLFGGVLVVLTVFFVAYAFVGREIADGFGREELWAQQQGLTFSFLAGIFWVVAVITATVITTPNLIVDSICIAGVIVFTFLGSLYGASRTRTFSFGFKIGLWSGMLSSLLASVVQLLLTYVLLGSLQKYPQHIQEFAHSGDPDIMTYLVKHAIFASAAYLVVGLAQGLAFGALGALLGRTLARRKAVSA